MQLSFDIDVPPPEAGRSARRLERPAKTEIWLPFVPTDRTMCLAPDADFQHVLAGIRNFTMKAYATAGGPGD